MKSHKNMRTKYKNKSKSKVHLQRNHFPKKSMEQMNINLFKKIITIIKKIIIKRKKGNYVKAKKRKIKARETLFIPIKKYCIKLNNFSPTE
jgi:predicted RNA-binding protein associated with RNAse of E/G family